MRNEKPKDAKIIFKHKVLKHVCRKEVFWLRVKSENKYGHDFDWNIYDKESPPSSLNF